MKLSSINARLIAGLFFLVALGGCAAPQTRALLKSHAPQLSRQAELSETPFYPQEIHQCGPAALAMMLNAGGVKVLPQAMTQQVYMPGREGSLPVEMLAATRRNGLLAYQLAPSLEDLLAEIDTGTPVLVLQNLALSWYPMWHYAVVVGYDLQRQEIILRSGLERRQVLPFSTFEHTWARAGYWGMLALPPGGMPRTATETAYVGAAVALEKNVSPQRAEAAYAAGLKRWPHNLAALIGMGNSAYARGDMPKAEKYFRQAILDCPDSPVGHNNLAQVLADQQHYSEALASAQQAVSLGGAEHAAAQNTLLQIKNMMRK